MNEREILDQLILEKRITEEDIAGASSRVLTLDMKDLIDMLHTRLCTLNHDTGECEWYVETSGGITHREDEWKRPYHLAWVKLFHSFLASAELIKLLPEGVGEESSS